MPKLLNKEYSVKDDIIWKLEGKEIVFYNEGRLFAKTSLENIVLNFVVSEMTDNS
jgi:hypothetical protein